MDVKCIIKLIKHSVFFCCPALFRALFPVRLSVLFGDRGFLSRPRALGEVTSDTYAVVQLSLNADGSDSPFS